MHRSLSSSSSSSLPFPVPRKTAENRARRKGVVGWGCPNHPFIVVVLIVVIVIVAAQHRKQQARSCHLGLHHLSQSVSQHCQSTTFPQQINQPTNHFYSFPYRISQPNNHQPNTAKDVQVSSEHEEHHQQHRHRPPPQDDTGGGRPPSAGHRPAVGSLHGGTGLG